MRVHRGEFKTLAMCVSALARIEGVSLEEVLARFNHGGLHPGDLRALRDRVKRLGRVDEVTPLGWRGHLRGLVNALL